MTPFAIHAEVPSLPTYLLVKREGVGMLPIFLWGEQAGHPKPEELGQGRSGAEAEDKVFAELCYEVLDIRL